MKKRVHIKKTSKYISIQSYLIGRFVLPNLESEILYLACDVSMKVLGEAIEKKLHESREIPEVEFMELLTNRGKIEEFNKLEEKKLIKKYGYKNRRELCKDGLYLSVSVNDIISITPFHQYSLNSITGVSNKNGEIVEFEYPLNLSHEELGMAIMKGFEHCTSIYK